MKIAGIISEYNPFHLGHARHIRLTREQAGADIVVCIMSGCFVQRGEISCLPVDTRLRMALDAGADLVFALPAAGSLGDAEHFARWGTWLADRLGCDILSFGAEEGSLTRLEHAASLLEHMSGHVREHLRAGLATGMSWARAVSEAIGQDPDVQCLLERPNNILAISYLRAMQNLHLNIRPFTVERKGDYHDTSLAGPFPSASAVRAALSRGDYAGVHIACGTGYTFLQEAVRNGAYAAPNALDQLLLYTLRTMPVPGPDMYRDAEEGLPQLLKKHALTAPDRESLLRACVSARYPRARLSRLASRLLLDLPDIVCDALPAQAWLLGYRRQALPALREIGRRAEKNGVTIHGAAADITDIWMPAEIRAWDLRSLAVRENAGAALRHRVVVQD